MLMAHAEPRRPSSRKLEKIFYRPPAKLLPASSWDFAVMFFSVAKMDLLSEKQECLSPTLYLRSECPALPAKWVLPFLRLKPRKVVEGVLDHNHTLVGKLLSVLWPNVVHEDISSCSLMFLNSFRYWQNEATKQKETKAWVTARSVKLYKPEDLSAILTLKAKCYHTCVPWVGKAEIGGSLSSVVGQPSLDSKIQFTVWNLACLKNVM